VPTYQVSNTSQDATGLDLQVQWQPLDDLQFGFNGSYIDSKYSTARVPAGLDGAGNAVYLDVSGEPVDEPKFSYSVSGAYTWHGIARGDLVFHASYGYRGRMRCNDASVYQGKCALPTNFDLGAAQQRTDLRIDWNAGDGHWGLAPTSTTCSTSAMSAGWAPSRNPCWARRTRMSRRPGCGAWRHATNSDSAGDRVVVQRFARSQARHPGQGQRARTEQHGDRHRRVAVQMGDAEPAPQQPGKYGGQQGAHTFQPERTAPAFHQR